MLRKLKKKGFVSIVEVIVTSVIFILAAFGIFSSISMLRPAGIETSKRLDAAYLGREYMTNIYNSINTYTNNTKYGDVHTPYTFNWYIIVDSATSVRHMFMNVTY